MNLAWIDSASCSPIKPQPAWCVDMWSARRYIFTVLFMPPKVQSRVANNILMASSIHILKKLTPCAFKNWYSKHLPRHFIISGEMVVQSYRGWYSENCRNMDRNLMYSSCASAMTGVSWAVVKTQEHRAFTLEGWNAWLITSDIVITCCACIPVPSELCGHGFLTLNLTLNPTKIPP